MRAAFVLVLLLAAPMLAGCTRPGDAGTPGPIDTPPPTTTAHFEVSNVTITATNDANRSAIYEDDAGATIRYTIRQPGDTERETAFVTYVLNGRIIDVQQLTLDAGEEKSYERKITDLRTTRDIEVTVRAGSAIQRAEAHIQVWPRAGSEALDLGPLTIRADYGLLQQDRRALANLSLVHDGSSEHFDDFRMRMVCLDAQGAFVTTATTSIVAPASGEQTSADVIVDDCRVERYGMEFLATGDGGRPLVGRLLLVPPGWTPPHTQS